MLRGCSGIVPILQSPKRKIWSQLENWVRQSRRANPLSFYQGPHTERRSAMNTEPFCSEIEHKSKCICAMIMRSCRVLSCEIYGNEMESSGHEARRVGFFYVHSACLFAPRII